MNGNELNPPAAAPAPAVPRVEVCCQQFDTCRNQCVPLVDHLRGQIKELKAAPAVPQGFSITRRSDGTLCVSNERIGFIALTDEEKSLEGRLLYSLAGALLAATPATPSQEPVACGKGCSCLVQCGDTYAHAGLPQPSQEPVTLTDEDIYKAVVATWEDGYAPTFDDYMESLMSKDLRKLSDHLIAVLREKEGKHV